MTTSKQLALDFCKFNDASKSPYHAVASLSTILRDNSFTYISETSDWKSILKPGGRYFTTRNGSTVIAFTLPSNLPSTTTSTTTSTTNGFSTNTSSSSYPVYSIIAAHTDSPCFKVKPISNASAHGYIQVGVECYGGGLWHTWFDRDLTVAGRVIIRDKDNNNKVTHKLVTVPRPILRIPNLAIHLSRNINVEGFKVNKETDTMPIIATQMFNSTTTNTTTDTITSKKNSRHTPLLLECIAQTLNIDAKQIVDIDLCLADTQPAAIGGAHDEFLFAPRLDNLASCFSAIQALINSSGSSTTTPTIRLVACFDHEEIGSTSAVGADSSLLPNMLARISNTLSLDFERMVPRSLLVSADMAHAIHPNYPSKHESRHRPALGAGLVIKTNQNQRYATNGITGFVVREAARRCNVPVQEFVVPNDKGCGSTVGPYLASKTGMQTVDVGQPQLAMHSIREMCATSDFDLVVKLLTQIMTEHVDIMDQLVDNDVPGSEN